MVSLVERLYKAHVTFRKSPGGVDFAEIDDIPIAKVCTSCDNFKLLNEFSVRKSGVLNRMNHCKECQTIYKRSLGREYLNEMSRRYREKHPEKTLAYYHSRRARIAGLPVNFSEKDIDSTLHSFGGGCALTGSSDFHWDHVIPVATGYGGTTFGNMIPLRSDLNVSKKDRNIFEWFENNYVRLSLERDKFNHLIEWLAGVNGMSLQEYRGYVYSCFEEKEVSD